MSKRKGRVAELETQIRNLKVKQGRILKASKNNHEGLKYWKEEYYALLDGLGALGIAVYKDGSLNVVSVDLESAALLEAQINGRSDTRYV